MGNFFDNFWNTISVLAWSDWLTLIILVFFVIRGFVKGLAKEIISLLFVILAIALAWLYYDNLAISLLSDPTTSEGQSIFALSFGAIFLGIWFVKKKLYKIAEIKSYLFSKKHLTTSQIELILLKHKIPLPAHSYNKKKIAEIKFKEQVILNIVLTIAILGFIMSLISVRPYIKLVTSEIKFTHIAKEYKSDSKLIFVFNNFSKLSIFIYINYF